MTTTQFQSALRDILGVSADSVGDIEPDSWIDGFAVIGASTVVTSESGVEEYQGAIESVVNAVFDDTAKRGTFIGCTAGTGAQDTCLRGFLDKVGKRAWRRPLEAAEIDRLATLSASAAQELGDVYQGYRWATVALFVSPNFLYRNEVGAPVSAGSTTLRYTNWEMASRLGFLLLNSVPDSTLLDQAASGMLATSEGVRQAATRLLDTPAGRAAIGAFATEYLRLDRILTQGKDAVMYPEFNEALQRGIIQDMRGTWEVLAFDDKASALELYTTSKVVANKELAQLYGLSASGLDSTSFKTLSLPADSPRAGLLGKTAFLSQFANQKEGSPTLRGQFIREGLLCTPIPKPPGDVDTMIEDAPAGTVLTKREKLERHRSEPSCAACHQLMDPMGLPLESFDALGRFRTQESGKTIDTTGDLEGKPVANSKELGQALAQSTQAAQCLVRKYYSYAAGHSEREVDASVIQALSSSFQQSGYKLRDLVLDIVSHDAFSLAAPQAPAL